jgi:hypothetical protein
MWGTASAHIMPSDWNVQRPCLYPFHPKSNNGWRERFWSASGKERRFPAVSGR